MNSTPRIVVDLRKHPKEDIVREITPEHLLSEEDTFVASSENTTQYCSATIMTDYEQNRCDHIFGEEEACLDALVKLVGSSYSVFEALMPATYKSLCPSVNNRCKMYRDGRDIYVDTSLLSIDEDRITSDMLLYLTDIIQMVYANSCASSDMIVSLKKFCKAVDTNRRNNRVMMNTMCDWAFEISTFVIDALTTGEMSRLAIEEGEHKWTWLHYGSIIAGNHQFFLSFYKKLIVFLKSHNAYATSLFVLENIIASCTIDPYYPQGSLCALALKTEVGRIKGWFQQVKKSVKNYSFRRLELNESKRSNVVTKSYEKFVKQNISLPYFSLKFVK